MQNKASMGALIVAIGLAGALSACKKEATGQVAAVVNGDEVSQQELNTEASSLPVGPNANKDEVRRIALQRIVERRLIAQQAKDSGLDRDPEYLTRKRLVDETLLLEMYGKKLQGSLRVPDAAAIDKFIAEHPNVFAARQVFTVDQVRMPPQKDPAVLQALQAAKTQDQIIATLRQRNMPFQRGTEKIDSARVPPQVLAQVKALPPGEPFIVPGPQGIAVSVITNTESAPLPAAQSRPIAVQAMRNEALGKALEQQLKDAKAKAKIEYQPGFGPPAGGAGKAAPKA